MIKLAAVFLLTQFITGNVSYAPIEGLPTADKPYMLTWVSTEPCPECASTHPIFCTSIPSGGCGVTTKSVAHYAPFKSAAEALEVANANNLEGVSLFRAESIPIEAKETMKHDPQPDKVTPIRKYTLKP